MGRTCVGDVTLRRTCQLSTVEECLGRDPSAGSPQLLGGLQLVTSPQALVSQHRKQGVEADILLRSPPNGLAITSST